MRSRNPHRRPLHPWAVVAAALLGIPPLQARAVDFTWAGAAFVGGSPNPLWSAPGNWSPASVPTSGDNVTFASGFASGTDVRLVGPQSVARFLVSASTATPFSISGDATTSLTVNNGFSHAGTAPVTFNVPLLLNPAAGSFSNVTAPVTLNGGIRAVSPGGSLTVSKSGAGRLTLGGTYDRTAFNVTAGTLALASGSAPISGPPAFINLSPGTTLDFTASLSLAHTVGTVTAATPPTALRLNTFSVSVPSLFVAAGTTLTVSDTSSAASLSASTSTFNGVLRMAGSGTLTLNGFTGNLDARSGRVVFPANSPSSGQRSLTLSGARIENLGFFTLQTLTLGPAGGTLAGTSANASLGIIQPLVAAPDAVNAPLLKTGPSAVNLSLGGTWSGPLTLDGGTTTVNWTSEPANPITLVSGTLRATAVNVTPVLTAQGDARVEIGFNNNTLAALEGSGRLTLTSTDYFANPSIGPSVADATRFTGELVLGTQDFASAFLPLTVRQPPAATAAGLVVNPTGRLNLSSTFPARLSGAGTVAVSGSLVPVALGDPTSPVGFDFDGTLLLDNPDAPVVLRDADTARLGTLTVLAGRTTLASAGPVVLSPGRTLRADGVAVVSAPLTNNGSVAAPSPAVLQFAGPLSGSGTFSGTIAVASLLSPGPDPAPLPTSPSIATVSFDTLLLGPTSVLALDLAGFDSYDRLTAAGAVSLSNGAALSVSLVGGYLPPDRFRFDLVTAPLIFGTFTTVQLPSEFGPQWYIEYTPTRISLTNLRVVPEPGRLAAFPLMAASLRRRRK